MIPTISPTTTPTAQPTADAAPASTAAMERLDALAARMDRVLAELEPVAALARQAPLMLGIGLDTFDALVAQGRQQGIDVDARMRASLALLERVTAPETVSQLDTLLRHLGAITALAPMLDDAPALLADAQRTAQPTGFFGTLSALRDPHVQQTIGITVAMARAIGERAAPSGGTR